MKKALLLCGILLLSVLPLHATEARLNALGIANWMVEEDDNLIWFNPSRIRDYPRVLWGELGTAAGSGAAPTVDANVNITNKWGGVSGYCPIIEGAVLGVFVNRPYRGFVGTAGFTPAGSDITAPVLDVFGNSLSALTPQTKFEAFYALPRPVLQWAKVGFRLSYASNFVKNDSTLSLTPSTGSVTANEELNSSELVLAIGGQLSRRIRYLSDLDCVLTIGLPSVQNTYRRTFHNGMGWTTADAQNLELSSKLNLGFSARATLPLRGAPLLAYFDYQSHGIANTSARTRDGDLNGTINNAAAGDLNFSQDRSQKHTAFTLGASYNLRTSPKTLTLIAAALQQTTSINNTTTTSLLASESGTSEAYNTDTSNFSIPMNFAIEHTLSRIITTRIGVSQNLYQMTTLNVNDPDYSVSGTRFQQTGLTATTSKSHGIANTTISLGAGITVFKGLAIDTIVRQQVLFSGTYLVSGIPETLVSQLSVLYQF